METFSLLMGGGSTHKRVSFSCDVGSNHLCLLLSIGGSLLRENEQGDATSTGAPNWGDDNFGSKRGDVIELQRKALPSFPGPDENTPPSGSLERFTSSALGLQ